MKRAGTVIARGAGTVIARTDTLISVSVPPVGLRSVGPGRSDFSSGFPACGVLQRGSVRPRRAAAPLCAPNHISLRETKRRAIRTGGWRDPAGLVTRTLSAKMVLEPTVPQPHGRALGPSARTGAHTWCVGSRLP